MVENYLQEKSILLFSMGYPKDALIKEWLYNEAGIVGSGADDDTILKDEDWKNLLTAARRISEERIYIDDTEYPSMQQIISKAEEFEKKYDRCLVFINRIPSKLHINYFS